MREKNKEGSGTLEENASDRLGCYREQLERLRLSSEAVASLRERVAGLEARANALAGESASLADDDEAFQRESELVTTLSVIEAKVSRAREKLRQAQSILEACLAGVRGEFGRLHLIYKLWRVEIEKRKLSSEMVSGCPNLSLEQVALHLKSIADLRELEITAQDVVGLVRQCERLLQVLAGERDFELPPVSAGPVASVAVAPAETEWSGPWDPLDGSIDIQAEISRLLAVEPGLTLTTFHPRLRARFPHLYKKREEVVAMNAPLDGLASGVYEEQKGSGYKLYVEPIGSATVD